MLVPLLEILAESLESGVASQKVLSVYDHLVNKFEGEFSLLLKTPINDINTEAGEKIAEAILKVRSGDIVIEPGYDGVFGKVAIWKEPSEEVTLDQETLF